MTIPRICRFFILLYITAMIEEIKKSISDREIRYRAWDIKEKEMIYDIQDCNNWLIYYTFTDFIQDNWKDFYVMQYTWLKDKNWNPIYEWDIVKRRQKDWGIIEADNNEYICFIDWFMNWWACRKNRDHCWFTFWWEHIEVIWNIFESPELIQ